MIESLVCAQDPDLLGFSFNVTVSVGFLLVSLPAPISTCWVHPVLSFSLSPCEEAQRKSNLTAVPPSSSVRRLWCIFRSPFPYMRTEPNTLPVLCFSHYAFCPGDTVGRDRATFPVLLDNCLLSHCTDGPKLSWPFEDGQWEWLRDSHTEPW